MIITFPNHIFSKLQSLDSSVHGPFKNFESRALDAWIKSNPGKTMTIYNIPFILCLYVSNSLTPMNIKSGISVTGIRQCNSDIFIDENFLPSALNVHQRQNKKQKSTILEVSVSNSAVSSHSLTSSLNADASSKTNEHQLIAFDIMPYPKRTRKCNFGVSVIITHTPVKDAFTETKDKP